MTLPNARLVFRGVADVEAMTGAEVLGGLWQLTPKCEAALDRYEGVRGGLYRKEYVTIRRGRRRPETVLLYQMNSDRYGAPSPYYLDVIREGYEDFGLDPAALDAAVKATRKEVAAYSKRLSRAWARLREMDVAAE